MDTAQILVVVGKCLLYLVALLAGLALLLAVVGALAYGLMQVVFALLPASETVRFLSWRYLLKRGTNLIGVFGIFLAVGALILILSIMTGFLEECRRSARGSLSDVIVMMPPTTSFGVRPPLDPQKVLELVRGYEEVEGATAHLGWLCILTRDDRPESSVQILSDPQQSEISGVQLTGIDLDSETSATEFRASLERALEAPDGDEIAVTDLEHPFALPPEYEQVGRPRAGIIVGEKVMLFHRLQRGDKITLLTGVPDPDADSDEKWAVKKRQFVITGAFRSGENEIDLQRVYVERDQLARFLAGVNEDAALPAGKARYSEVLLKLKDYDSDSDEVVRRLRTDLLERGWIADGRYVKTWEDYRGMLLGAIENERVLMGIMLSLILVVAGFTIFAILSMMVSEKRRDIGILTALGATPNGVLLLFLMIGLWDALIGATAGAAAGVWAALKIDPLEKWLSSTFHVTIFNRDVYAFDSIPSVVTPMFVAMIVLGAFACTLVFAAIPAWRAARLDPVEALRYE